MRGIGIDATPLPVAFVMPRYAYATLFVTSIVSPFSYSEIRVSAACAVVEVVSSVYAAPNTDVFTTALMHPPLAFRYTSGSHPYSAYLSILKRELKQEPPLLEKVPPFRFTMPIAS